MTTSLTEEDKGGVVGYDGAVNYSEYNAGTGGSRRRKGGKRGRKSKKHMKRMYKGGNQEQKSEPEPSVDEDVSNDDAVTNSENVTNDNTTPPVGGRRRSKKMHKGKMHKGKIHKGKSRKGKVSKWITHVKNFSRDNKIDFRDALKDARCKASYHKKK